MKTIYLVFIGLCLTVMIQAQVSKTAHVSAGNLMSSLTTDELHTITTLTLTGTIDARDFKTMRDEMPALTTLDMTEITILAYTGTEGTSWSTNYPDSAIPEFAFYQIDIGGKANLVSVLLPSSISVIGHGAFTLCTGLTTVKIPTSVVAIQQSAFESCNSLTSIDLPSSVTYMGAAVFANCSNLTSVGLPPLVTTIPYATFWGCQALTSVKLPTSLTSIDFYAFYKCSSLETLEIPSSVTSIGRHAFEGCHSLVTLLLPQSIASIGESAFEGCARWTGPLDLPSGLTRIEKWTFAYCSSLNSVLIPSSVDSIGECAFNGCSGLTGNLTLPSVSYIGAWAFNNCSGLTGSLIIPPTVTSIENYSFAGCSALTSLVIPPTISAIGSGAFKGCKSLNSIDSQPLYPVPLDYTIEVFEEVDTTTCRLLIPYGSKQLYETASGWKDFNTILPANQGFLLSTTSLGFEAGGGTDATVFMNANVSWTVSADESWITVSPTSGTSSQSLTVTAQANVSGTARKATITFYGTGVPSQIITIGQQSYPKVITVAPGGLATALTSKEKLTVTNLVLMGQVDARDFKTINDELPLLNVLDLSGATIAEFIDTTFSNHLLYPANTIPAAIWEYVDEPFTDYSLANLPNLISVILPASLTSIGYRAFMGCTGLTSMAIPPSVATIGIEAFFYCNGLKTVLLPPSVTQIGENAFSECSSLTSIELPPNITYIPSYVFGNCKSLRSIELPESVTSIESGAFYGCSELQKVVIPSQVTTIDASAFEDCSSLSVVVIPSSVTIIGLQAFKGCTSLSTLTIPPSVMYIKPMAFWGCRNLTSIYSLPIRPPILVNSGAGGVFDYVDKTFCQLQVPYGSRELYANTSQWKEFKTIVEMPGFRLSSDSEKLEAHAGSTVMINLEANVLCTLSSDQAWLTVNPTSCTGNQLISITAEANVSASVRSANVTVRALGLDPKTIALTQNALPVGVLEIAQNNPQFNCYPNPFIQHVAIEIQNPKRAKIIVEICNLAGQKVSSLVTGNTDENLILKWDGTSDRGQKVSPGIYICRMNEQSKQLIFGDW